MSDKRLEFYKKHYIEYKKSNVKSQEWKTLFHEVEKKIFSEKIPNISMIQILLIISIFEYQSNEDGAYKFGTEKNHMKNYINHFNNIVNGFKTKIEFYFKEA